MSKLTIEIDLDNAAFDDNGLAYELRLIFNQLIDKAIDAKLPMGFLRDTNGNSTGNYKLTN